jgi:hypothetical protein
MRHHLRSSLFFFIVTLALIAGCTGGKPAPVANTDTPTAPPPSATPLPTQPPTDTPTVEPSPTNTPPPTKTAVPPTATQTPAPPTPTPTRTRPPATKTPKPTLPPTAVPAPTEAQPTAPESMPGVDVVVINRGVETCVSKFVAASYPWEEGPGDRRMYYWDRSWSVYPKYAKPNIKIETARGICNDQKQCSGFTAVFCVYVTGDAPSGGTYESVLDLVIISANPDGSGQNLLAEVQTPFTWYIK